MTMRIPSKHRVEQLRVCPDAPIKKAQLVVGYEELPRRRSYILARNCYAPVPGVSYRRRTRVPVEKINRQIARRGLTAVYIPSSPARVDVTHLWNKVSVGTGPWGATFESAYPKVWDVPPNARRLDVLRRVVAQPRCQFLVAMSRFAENFLLRSLEDSDYRDPIAAKLHQVYPYQPVLTDATPRTQLRDRDPLRMIFVGSAFFRKGGDAVLRLVERYGAEWNVEATIISQPTRIDYATRHLDQAYASGVIQRLESNPRIAWRRRTSNDEVLDAMRASHVGVLPTLADTFGFSLLEAMANGLPILGTNVQAGPEITDHDGAWRVDLDIDEIGYWSQMNTGREAYEVAIEELVAGMMGMVSSLRENPASLVERSVAALAHVRSRYSRDRTHAMQQVYGVAPR